MTRRAAAVQVRLWLANGPTDTGHKLLRLDCSLFDLTESVFPQGRFHRIGETRQM